MKVQVSLWNNDTKSWNTCITIYQIDKSLESEDLKIIPGIRENVIRLS